MVQLKLFVIASIVILALCSDKKITGTSDETLSGVAKIYLPNHNPAPGAQIKLYRVDDTSRTPIFQTITNAAGAYSLKGAPAGLYNLFAFDDSLIAYQDSILVYDSLKTTAQNDTLERSGSLTAWVGVQPNDNPQNVFVHVIGTYLYSNVNTDGSFTLQNIATGKYMLEFVPSNMQGYITTFGKVAGRGGHADTLLDTFHLIFTGVPVVGGAAAHYDTIDGIVTLCWNKTTYAQWQEYVLYKTDETVITPDVTKPYRATTDTFFIDTIFQRSIDQNRRHIPTYRNIGILQDTTPVDTRPYGYYDKKFKYYVAIKNVWQNVGSLSKTIPVSAPDPFRLGHLFNGPYLTASPCAPCSLHIAASPWYGSITKYEWDIGATGTFRQLKKPDTMIIINNFSSADTQIVCKITGSGGRSCLDTATIIPGLQWDRIAPPIDTGIINIFVLQFNEALYTIATVYSGDKFDYHNYSTKIRKSGDGISWTTLLDTSSFLQQYGPVSFKGNLYALNDSGIMLRSADARTWNINDATLGKVYGLVSFQSTLYGVKRIMNSTGTPLNELWASTDGKQWAKQNDLNFGIAPIQWTMTLNDTSIILWSYLGSAQWGFTRTTTMRNLKTQILDEVGVPSMNYCNQPVEYAGSVYLFSDNTYRSTLNLNGWAITTSDNFKMSGTNSFIGYTNAIFIVFNDKLYSIGKTGVFRAR